MKMDRVGNAKRNIIFGMFSMGISLLLPFISRTVLIYTLGELYVGLSGLFQSVFQLLNMLELGFGVALVYFLYEPIAKDEQSQIRAILKYYRSCYRKIGTVILILGFCIMPFVSFLIKGQEIPDVNIYIVYFVMLINAVTGYFVFPQAKALLTAYQRNDISHKITIVFELLKNVFQIIVLVLFKNYYLYILIIPVCEFLNDILHVIITGRSFPDIRCEGVLDNEFKARISKKISGLFTYKVGNVISNFADSIIISAFLGLEIVALYSNYYYIITALFSILAVYYSAITAGLGNSIVLETVEDNYKNFQVLQFVQEWMTGWIAICLVCLFQPFVTLWLGADWLLPFPFVLLLAILFYIWKIQDIVTVYKEAAGLWDKDKYRPLISSLINLLLNILTVQKWGLYGVVLSTIVSVLIVDIPWVARSLFQTYFKKKLGRYYLRMLKVFLINLVLGGVTYLCCRFVQSFSSIFNLLLCIVVCLLVPNIINFIIYRKRWEFKEAITKIRVWRDRQKNEVSDM